MKTKHFVTTAILCVFLMCSVVLTGCATVGASVPIVGHRTNTNATPRQKYETVNEFRTWTLDYEQTTKIATEPAGCKIYCQEEYLGISPLEVDLDGATVVIQERGSYKVKNIYGLWNGARLRQTRESETVWSGDLEVISCDGSWIIQAFHEGYDPEKVEVFPTPDSMADAIGSIEITSDGDLPDVIEGYRPLLLALYPAGSARAAQPQIIVVPSGFSQQSPSVQQHIILEQKKSGAEKAIDVENAFIGGVQVLGVFGELMKNR